MTNSLAINRGSDLSFSFIWPDENGDPMNLTGYTADFFELHPALTGNLSVAITNAAAGEVTVSMEWDDAMPSGNTMFFRVRISAGEFNQTLPLIYISVS